MIIYFKSVKIEVEENKVEKVLSFKIIEKVVDFLVVKVIGIVF